MKVAGTGKDVGGKRKGFSYEEYDVFNFWQDEASGHRRLRTKHMRLHEYVLP